MLNKDDIKRERDIAGAVVEGIMLFIILCWGIYVFSVY
jgi:hypothetical protein